MGMGVGAVVLGTTALAGSAPENPGQAAPPQPENNPFPGLVPGAKLAGVWTVTAVHMAQERTVAVHLAEHGHTFRLNVLKRDPLGVPGIGESRSLAVYVCNNGHGQRQTVEIEGQAARALAAWLDAFEAGGGRVPELATLREHARPGENSTEI